MQRQNKWPWKKGRWRAFRNIPVFWMHQRTTNLDRSELVFHLTLNLLIVFTIYLLFSLAGAFSHVWPRILVSIIIARTLSWVLNDHFWGGIQVSFAFVSNRGAESFLTYLINSSERVSKFRPIYGCLVYGSLVRGKFHKKSDLDVLYVRRPGFMNGVLALCFALRERIISFFTRIPLDLYVGDSEKSLEKYRDDEIPIIIKDDSGELFQRYQNYIHFNNFIQEFESSTESKEDKN